MRRTLIVATLALGLGLAIPRAQADEPEPTGKERMETALVHIRYTLAALKQAPDGTGGEHREKAAKLVEDALYEVNKAIEVEKARGAKKK
jgi:hypothetical protein